MFSQLPHANNLRARVLDVGCVAFALFTLASNSAAFAGLSLYAVIALWCALCAGALALLYRRTRDPKQTLQPSASRRLAAVFAQCEPESRVVSAGARADSSRWFRACVLVAAAAVALVYVTSGQVGPLWLLSLAILGAGLLTETFGAYRLQPLHLRRSEERVLWALGVAAALLTLIVHRSSSDDTFYVNVAVAVADSPGAPVLAQDTMVGVPGLELNLPIYKVHAFEVFAGMLAYMLHLRPLAVCHWLLPALAALLVPLALGRLFQTLLPRSRALWAVAFVLAFYVFEGSAFEGFGNHAFVRLQHGKAIFLSLAVPMLIVYALRFSVAPTLGRWLLLCSAQIASVGLTSTALWLAPLVAAFSLASVWRPTWTQTRVVLVGLLASLHAVGLALRLRGDLARVIPPKPASAASGGLALPDRALTLLQDTLAQGLDSWRVQAAIFFVLLGGWALYRPGSAWRRFALSYLTLFLLLGLNPFTAVWVKDSVSPLFWRILWMLPVPALVAAGFCGLIRDRGPQWQRLASRALACTGLLIFLTYVPTVYALSSVNGVTLRRPAYKVAPEFRVAHVINRLTKDRGSVLAPENVSVWMTTEPRHAYPLATKPKYLRKQHSMSREEARLRDQLLKFVDGQTLQGEEMDVAAARSFVPEFRQALERFHVVTVCFQEHRDTAPVLREELKSENFTLQRRIYEFEIWTR